MNTSVHWNLRTEMLLGAEKLEKLTSAHVLLVGLGGVGAAAAEMLARAGIGQITLVDTDTVEQTNRNRQFCALNSTEGKLKTEVVAQRLEDINAQMRINTKAIYLNELTLKEVLEVPYTFVIDAIDTLAPKLYLIKETLAKGYPLVSAMGAGGKIDPLQVRVGDLSDSYNCHLARYVRKRLRRFGISGGFPVVFSPEDIEQARVLVKDGMRNKRSVIGTISYLPPIFGAVCASVAIRQICGIEVPYSIQSK